MRPRMRGETVDGRPTACMRRRDENACRYVPGRSVARWRSGECRPERVAGRWDRRTDLLTILGTQLGRRWLYPRGPKVLKEAGKERARSGQIIAFASQCGGREPAELRAFHPAYLRNVGFLVSCFSALPCLHQPCHDAAHPAGFFVYKAGKGDIARARHDLYRSQLSRC